MRISLRIIGTLGTVLFALLFSISFGAPDRVEASATGFVKTQIEKEVTHMYQGSKAASLADKTLLLARDLGQSEQQLIEDLENDLPRKIAESVASMCGYDCEKKKALTQAITRDYLDRMANLNIAQRQLGDVIKGKYLEIVGKLLGDLRLFLGSNALVFLALLSLSLLKPEAIAQLFLPGILLLVSTLCAMSIYIFGQDWFYTLLYNDYMGFSYLVYIGAIFGFLMDVALNRARITTGIINGILNTLGSAASCSPC